MRGSGRKYSMINLKDEIVKKKEKRKYSTINLIWEERRGSVVWKL